MLTYAIGDIHGHLGQLQDLHLLIEKDRAAQGPAEAPVIHIGDLVDRGPDSKGVIDFLIAGRARGADWVVLRGNHDRMFRGFLDDADYQDPRLRTDLYWLHERLGGAATLASYGVKGAGERFLHDLQADARAAVPATHVAFLDGLQNYHLRGTSLFVHAGVRPGVDLRHQTEDDLLWIRNDFLKDERDHGALIVHGHTPVDRVTHYGNRLNLDSGAGYGDPMSAVAIEGSEVFQLTPRGRVRIAP
ncbi:metallophosphoesterase family protein [Frigidibacter sp. RF13]|uniref:metallophosphoesterase family protein n=1 Tax=Frigidibacter sp. RF13 TaxID=2997340 RepID=UPI00226D922F|nr:metallophosphoesterase family protein [Frigidibacter sp. RF13]MCY1127838.1 metallophosphoesterase family protein [Frigidibacter sp. RF13]